MGNYWHKGSWVKVMEGEMLEAITLWRPLLSGMIWGKQLYHGLCVGLGSGGEVAEN